MKTISIIAFSFILSTHVFSQIKVGNMKAHSSTYVGKKIGTSSIEVNNTNDQIPESESIKGFKRLSETKYKDETALTSAFLKVFNNQRLSQLLTEKNIVLTMYLNRDGRIRSLQYLVKNNTLITPSELEMLEKYVKNTVIFIVPKGEDNSDKIWPITQVIFFQKLYEKSSIY